MLKIEDSTKKINELQSQNEKLRRELWKCKRKPTPFVAYGLLLFGGTVLVASIFLSSNIALYIGVALVFWGAILYFVKPTKYVKIDLVSSATYSSCLVIDKIMGELKLEGKGIYLPPTRLKSLKSGTIFIPRHADIRDLSLEAIPDDKVFLNPSGICLPPIGLGLVNLFEEEMGTDFNRVDLFYLQNNLPKLFVEGLEIARNLEIKIKGNRVLIRLTHSTYRDFCRIARKLHNVCRLIGCPICSSIACALTRATGKPVMIEETKFDDNTDIIKVRYLIMES